MLNKILYVILFGSFSICSSALLWRIETIPPAYIFGSIHIPYKLVWPYVSNETREAFVASTHFYAEIDAKSDVFWDDFLRCLANTSKNRTRRSSNRTDNGAILDVFLLTEASRLNKTVGSLEFPEYHCKKEGWRHDLPKWIRIVNFVKKEMKNPTITLDDLKPYLEKSSIKKYLCEEIDGRYIQTLYESRKEMKQIEERDKLMSKYMHKLLLSSKNNRYFFAIGAAHMLGNHRNLIVRLKKFGYKVKRVCTNRKQMKKKFGCKKKKVMKHCIKKTL